MDNSNAADNKLAPTKQLTDEQSRLVEQIKHFAIDHLNDDNHAVFTIYGDAGTGKSVILSKLFYDIQQMAHEKSSSLYQTNNYFLVNHPEILKVYKKMAGSQDNVLKKNFNRPTSFINQNDKNHQDVDITIIDEAHLLLSRGDHYNNFYYDNQLSEIIKRSQITILVFDHRQVLRTKSFWNLERLHHIIDPYTNGEYHLTHQFRMTASDSLVKWINTFTDGKLTPLPADAKKDYDFRIFDNAEEMRKAIFARNKEVGLSRIVSTSGYPSTLDGGKHYVTEPDFKMPWDQYNYTQTPWAEIPETVNEVGSMFTCQGFDLNYVGVILGPPIYLDGDDVHVEMSKFTDVESLKKRKDMDDPVEFEKIKEQLVLNSANVLLKRGVKGLYIFVHNPELRKRLLDDYKKL
ncbi:hypothetical protein AKUH3B111A_12890 [Apilactobacillus kunkeei]|uniref:DUF2075 domain-containing protein n=1 Tax=Apilactobacillus kunkeei TaxID=148814 RepID=UPI00110CDC7B|nr:DUF2075 domain-containing protein [Apilactobacillus kunkeei]TMS99661.1 DUF2075 domain-containing protein [Apilactobacillus kunkeei]CAI2647111.1 hypothetical protein AKUH1B302M_12550 [Apilactobacillus kunkeei]CAI2648853.1 hypothetical protein AKUH3B103M_12920 [Apilactobacillus kunkeei]CAI2651956.1 hypothetical protein AKUH3B104X_12920 [Apilactobacillus kunkeei]CAI2654034.1 hypothetical protein AKUH3B111A_12890 [Apilactobacillus kunkeei]